MSRRSRGGRRNRNRRSGTAAGNNPPQRKPRLNSRQRAALYPAVAAQQGGEYCVHCDRDQKQLGEDGESLQLCIDHVNNNPHDNRRVNLQLLCHSCNTSKNHPALPPTAEQEKPPSTEILLNRSYEGKFRRWVASEFMANENLLYEIGELVADGAELTGASTDTIKKYVLKMRSKFGMYDLFGPIAAGGKVYLKLKEQYRSRAEPLEIPTEAADAEPDAQQKLDEALDGS